ncbi:preprotein translocase subunit YajC [Actinokineospora inagensis]|uniref:preprotein translocase subunit YajC n=1 Tax=Actinokineospora inagensis TaxID=103730 RepID=UPI00041C3FCC|nr:preprotein translocase subunit YajC [Actinokineospora inagensis]
MNQSLILVLMIAVLAIPLVLNSRRQKRMAAEQKNLLGSLSVGDRVMTTSGLYGTVSDVSDEATIGIEIAPGVETTWLRQAIREKVGPDLVDEDEDIDEVDSTLTGEHESIPAEGTTETGKSKN